MFDVFEETNDQQQDVADKGSKVSKYKKRKTTEIIVFPHIKRIKKTEDPSNLNSQDIDNLKRN